VLCNRREIIELFRILLFPVCHVYLEHPFGQSGAQILKKESKEINVHITGCNVAEDEEEAKELP